MEFFSFDESYLQRLRGGDFPTEQHFVDYFGQLLLIKLRSRLRSPQTVDDIRQETFVRAEGSAVPGREERRGPRVFR